MHSYVNGMPKNGHNIGVVEQLHFQVFCGKEWEIKCSKMPKAHWKKLSKNLCNTWMMISIILWLLLWLLFPNIHFSKSRYVGQ